MKETVSNISEIRMDKIFVDTDILIDYTHDKSKILRILLSQQKQSKVELFINPVVLAEFFTDKKFYNNDYLERISEFLGIFNLLDITEKIGLLAGKYLRENKTNALGDALIAASCLTHNLKLATRNKKHFQKIPGLQFYE